MFSVLTAIKGLKNIPFHRFLYDIQDGEDQCTTDLMDRFTHGEEIVGPSVEPLDNIRVPSQNDIVAYPQKEKRCAV